MRVYYPNPPSEEVLEDMRRAVPSGIEIFSESRPDDFEVIIEGRPEADQLDVPSLRALIVPFAGVPLVTLDLLRERRNIGGHNLHHNAVDTAEVALALLLAAAKEVVPMDQALRRNEWLARYGDSNSVSLAGKTAVLLGYGEIGRRLGRALLALDMRVVAVRRREGDTTDGDVRVVGTSSLHEVLPSAHALIIAVPHTAETTGLIGKRELELLPPKAVLVNVARGAVVDEAALFEALQTGRLHSAGLDVWYRYPEAAANAVPGYFHAPEAAKNTAPAHFPFGELPNVVMSPHRAGTSRDTELRRVEHLAEVLRALHEGREAPNRIQLDAGY